MSVSREEEERGARLRSRLWGAAVLIAVLVIVLPLVLDGSGSESRFRRVETLREEPPRVLGADGRREPAAYVGANTRVVEPVTRTPERSEQGATSEDDTSPLRIRVGEADPPDYMRTPPSERTVLARQRTEALSAWIVQAGSFASEANALAVRDTLRKAGFASFVVSPDTVERDEPLFRVRVGPMIDEGVASATQRKVATLTGLKATVVSYP